ncbi:hypothetical protein JQK62_18085 [Leptospira santarosai]|nr:hypothetical protein [Leptospira santarosai]
MSNFEIFELIMGYTIVTTLAIWILLAVLRLLIIAIIWRKEIISFFKSRKREQ